MRDLYSGDGISPAGGYASDAMRDQVTALVLMLVIVAMTLLVSTVAGYGLRIGWMLAGG